MSLLFSLKSLEVQLLRVELEKIVPLYAIQDVKAPLAGNRRRSVFMVFGWFYDGFRVVSAHSVERNSCASACCYLATLKVRCSEAI